MHPCWLVGSLGRLWLCGRTPAACIVPSLCEWMHALVTSSSPPLPRVQRLTLHHPANLSCCAGEPVWRRARCQPVLRGGLHKRETCVPLASGGVPPPSWFLPSRNPCSTGKPLSLSLVSLAALPPRPCAPLVQPHADYIAESVASVAPVDVVVSPPCNQILMGYPLVRPLCPLRHHGLYCITAIRGALVEQHWAQQLSRSRPACLLLTEPPRVPPCCHPASHR